VLLKVWSDCLDWKVTWRKHSGYVGRK